MKKEFNTKFCNQNEALNESEKCEDFGEDAYGNESLVIPRELLITNTKNKECGYDVEDDIRELAYSIREYGLAAPLNVIPLSDGGYFVAGGNRRLKALRYGDEQGWDWFRDGFPCTISKSPNDKKDEIDQMIWIHEMNIHNRDNSNNFHELVRNLLALYRQKQDKNMKQSENEKELMRILADKLGVQMRWCRDIMFVSEKADKWIREACDAHKISRDCAKLVGHMPEDIREEMHQYFLKNGKIENSVLSEASLKKFLLYDIPDWLREAIENNIITKKLAYKIYNSKRNSWEALKIYYEENRCLPAEIISKYLEDKKGNHFTKEDIKKIEAKAREEDIIASVTSGKVNLKEYRDPIEFDVEGLNTVLPEEEYAGSQFSDIDEGENYLNSRGKDYFNNVQSGDECEDDSDDTEYYEDDYKDSSYEVPDTKSYVDSYSDGNIDEPLNTGDKTEDIGSESGQKNTSILTERNNEWVSEKGNSGNAPTSRETYESVMPNDDALNKKRKNTGPTTDPQIVQKILSDSIWVLRHIDKKGTMNETERIYLDMMFLLMKNFYFPSIAKDLKAGRLSEKKEKDLRDIINMITPHLS